jgi:hypothetical protein
VGEEDSDETDEEEEDEEQDEYADSKGTEKVNSEDEEISYMDVDEDGSTGPGTCSKCFTFPY